MNSWTRALVTCAALFLAPGAFAADDGASDAGSDAGSVWELDSGDGAAALAPTEVAPAAPAPIPAAPADDTSDADAATVAEVAVPAARVESADPSEVAPVPSAAPAPSVEPSLPASASVARPVVRSGTPAVDAEGRRGVIHVVARGDTLWAISNAYLKTPWVWPSVWKDNGDIANPHLIHPGEHIWISSTEMRKVTPAEAAEMIEAQSELEVASDVELGEELPAAIDEEEIAFDEEAAPAAIGDEDVIAVAPPPSVALSRALRIPGVDVWSYVSEDVLEGATSIVSSVSPRTLLSQTDTIVIGLGEGETKVGDQFDVFVNADPVRDPRTGRTLGYYVDVAGWVEVTRVEGDAAVAEIRQSTSEIMRGYRLVPREPMPEEFATKAAPTDLEARIVYAPKRRTQLGNLDYVFIDRGSVHGLEIGSEITVYESGNVVRDRARGVDVRTPDNHVADLVIVSVQPTSAAAFVLEARRELHIGDTIRSGAVSTVTMR